jgi:hypothetical protein
MVVSAPVEIKTISRESMKMKTKLILSMLGLALVMNSSAQNISDKTQPLSLAPTTEATPTADD